MTSPQHASSDAAALLRARARALALPAAPQAPRDQLELLVFRIGSERWALETRYVREVLPLRGMTALPCTPPFVRGIINVRGHVVAVLDLKRLFGLAEQGLSDLHRVVLVEHVSSLFGVLADIDVGVVRVAPGAIGPAPAVLDGVGAACLKGVTADGLAVLDMEQIFNDPRIVVDDGGA